MDLPKLIFIDGESGNLKVGVDGGKLTRNNNRKRKSEVLQTYRCPLCDKCYRQDWVSMVFLAFTFFVGR